MKVPIIDPITKPKGWIDVDKAQMATTPRQPREKMPELQHLTLSRNPSEGSTSPKHRCTVPPTKGMRTHAHTMTTKPSVSLIEKEGKLISEWARS
jgi:hypothetical protein